MFDLEKGIFDLTSLNEMGDDDVLKTNADEVMTEDTNISIPGGLSEKPKGAPSDQSISIPGKTEISADEYNQAVTSLKKSFKEAVEVLSILENVKVVQESTEERLEREQNDLMENAMIEAALQALENGPIFEAVQKSDKSAVKKVVNKVRSKVAGALAESNVKFYKVNSILSALLHLGVGTPVTAGGITTLWKTRLWQIVGLVYMENANVNEVAKILNEKLADELGEYKIIPVRTPEGLISIFREKFGWKNYKKSYLLIVDKKLTMEIKNSIKEVNDAVKEATTESKEKGKPMSESEIEEYANDIYELTESYVGYAYMEKCGKGDVDCMKSELADRKKQLADLKKKDDDKSCKKCKHLEKSIDKLEKKIKKVEEKED